MITATVTGNVGKTPELRTTSGGKPMTTFGVASTYKRKGGEPTTTWVDVVCFDEAAEAVCESLNKGDRVMVTGRVELERYQKKDGGEGQSLRMIADDVALSVRFRKQESAPAGGSEPW
jgi:single-strand DNA-binding protein